MTAHQIRRQFLIEILRMLFTMLLAIGVICCIALRTIRLEDKPNGFKRTFYKTPVEPVEKWTNPITVVGIEGVFQHFLILKTKIPGIIWTIDLNSMNGHLDTLPFPPYERATWSYQYLIGDNGMVIAAGNIPGLYFRGPDNELEEYKFGSQPFTKMVRVSAVSFIARGFDKILKGWDQVFIKENIQTKERIINDSIFPLIHDAGLSTDGNLHFDERTGLLNYVPFYNNSLVGLDTNLNIIYRTTTIDSVFTSHTIIGSIKKDDQVKYTNSGPKKIVNTDNCVSDGLLYNRSLLKADNEDKQIFRKNGVIDIYTIKIGAYMGSIYIPFLDGEAPVAIKVVEHSMFVLYRNKLIRYRLPEEIYQSN